MSLYDLLWAGAIPFLRCHGRLADGFRDRTFQRHLQGPVDLWIQAASAGEAYLAISLIEHLADTFPVHVLVTTNTRQGFDMLSTLADDSRLSQKGVNVKVSFFPFDRPRIMERAVKQWMPKMMVVLETELWPGLLFQLKRLDIPILIVNGRITAASVNAYRRWPSLWRTLSPNRILAISEEDARRFQSLFPGAGIGTMPNIKFDRIQPFSPAANADDLSLRPLVHPDIPFILLGSVREEEEDAVERMIALLLHRRQDILIGLVPRHLHRVSYWKNRLTRIGARWHCRSEEIAPGAGKVLLWDTFGELFQAYSLATVAFVGGSLAPLGGQNFLEPLTCGVIPVIGPSWENFTWVGPTLFDRGLVRIAENWQDLSGLLLEIVDHPPDRKSVQNDFADCIQPLKGGSRIAVEAIIECLGADRAQPVPT